MTGLPQGWALAEVRDVVDDYDTVDPQRLPEQRFAYVDIGAIDNSVQRITEPKEILGKDAPSRARRVIKAGDVLFSTVRTYLKNVAQVPPELDGQLTSTGISVLRANSAADPVYLFRWACSDEFINEVSQAQDGTMYPAVRDEDVLAGPIPLPPLPEQRRIVRKLDILSARSTTARTHLAAIEKLVERYKSSVTALAVSGALTESYRRLNSLQEPKDATFGEWFDYKGGSQPPKSTFHPEPAKGRIRLLQIRDFASDDKAVYIDDNGKWPRCSADDIMVGRYGASVGKILSGKAGAYNVALVKWVFDRSEFDPVWIYALLKSDVFQRPIAAVSRSAQDGFNKGDVENIDFLKPCIEEQREIVRRIETAFAKIDRLAAEAAKALKLLGHLDQRILAKAFAGDLVPQDPNDEPASVLLDRIREARANAPKKQRQRRTKVYAMKEAPKDRLLADSATWPRNGLPFEDIAKRVTMPHDALRDAIFELLGGEKPLLEQVFDTSEERMRLKRVAQ